MNQMNPHMDTIVEEASLTHATKSSISSALKNSKQSLLLEC
jgi:hypothetical protein